MMRGPDWLSHDSKRKMYCMIRTECIKYIKTHLLDGEGKEMSNYSVFNCFWNNTMRHSYGLGENYIVSSEFERLCAMSRSGVTEYAENDGERLYHDLFGFNFHWKMFERKPLVDVLCCGL